MRVSPHVIRTAMALFQAGVDIAVALRGGPRRFAARAVKAAGSAFIGASAVKYATRFRIRFDRQLFMKVPALEAPAPTQSEPPFLGTQVVVVLVSIVLGILAAKGFSRG
jgi:hypothetical protein